MCTLQCKQAQQAWAAHGGTSEDDADGTADMQPLPWQHHKQSICTTFCFWTVYNNDTKILFFPDKRLTDLLVIYRCHIFNRDGLQENSTPGCVMLLKCIICYKYKHILNWVSLCVLRSFVSISSRETAWASTAQSCRALDCDHFLRMC